jgi:hypothetical protein
MIGENWVVLLPMSSSQVTAQEESRTTRQCRRARALCHWARIFVGQLRRGRRHTYGGPKASYVVFRSELLGIPPAG